MWLETDELDPNAYSVPSFNHNPNPKLTVAPKLILLKSFWDIFCYEHHCTLWYLHVVFRSLEHLVPQPAFKVGLHFWQIIIRSRASAHSNMNVVKEIKTKIHQRACYWQSITFDMSFIQMPASCSYNQTCNLFF